jgi:hypothetical protein
LLSHPMNSRPSPDTVVGAHGRMNRSKIQAAFRLRQYKGLVSNQHAPRNARGATWGAEWI